MLALWGVACIVASQQIQIQLANAMGAETELFWDGGPQGVVSIGKIGAAQQMPVDTFVGHSFIVDDGKGAKHKFTVRPKVLSYFIKADGVQFAKPKPIKRKPGNPLARFQGSHSVKFRNLDATPVHVYFDDGG